MEASDGLPPPNSIRLEQCVATLPDGSCKRGDSILALLGWEDECGDSSAGTRVSRNLELTVLTDRLCGRLSSFLPSPQPCGSVLSGASASHAGVHGGL